MKSYKYTCPVCLMKEFVRLANWCLFCGAKAEYINREGLSWR